MKASEFQTVAANSFAANSLAYLKASNNSLLSARRRLMSVDTKSSVKLIQRLEHANDLIEEAVRDLIAATDEIGDMAANLIEDTQIEENENE